MPVDTVQGHQMGVAQGSDQAPQQCLLDVLTARGHWQKMRFVSHHQMLIGIQDGFLHRNGRFVGHFAKVMNAQAFPVRQLRTDRRAVGIQHPATGDTVKPLFAADGTEVFTQTVEHRQPSARRQVQGAGLVLGGDKRLGRHRETRTINAAGDYAGLSEKIDHLRSIKRPAQLLARIYPAQYRNTQTVAFKQ